jgi:hypothetical protein
VRRSETFVAQARRMHGLVRMATTNNRFQNVWRDDHAGARWLAPFAAVLILLIGALVFMFVYPHLGLAGRL